MAVSKETIKLAVEYVALTNQALKLSQEIAGERKAVDKDVLAKAAAAQELLVKNKIIEPVAIKQAQRVLGTHSGVLDVLCNVLSRPTPSGSVKAASLGEGTQDAHEPVGKKTAEATRVIHTGQRVPVGQRESDQHFHSRMMGR